MNLMGSINFVCETLEKVFQAQGPTTAVQEYSALLNQMVGLQRQMEAINEQARQNSHVSAVEQGKASDSNAFV